MHSAAEAVETFIETSVPQLGNMAPIYPDEKLFVFSSIPEFIAKLMAGVPPEAYCNSSSWSRRFCNAKTVRMCCCGVSSVLLGSDWNSFAETPVRSQLKTSPMRTHRNVTPISSLHYFMVV